MRIPKKPPRRARTKTDPEPVRMARVRQLFLALPMEERSETGVLLFFRWLEQHHPELIPKDKPGDPFRHLKADLQGLYQEW